MLVGRSGPPQLPVWPRDSCPVRQRTPCPIGHLGDGRRFRGIADPARLGSGENPDAEWRPTVCRVIVAPQERPLAAGTATFAVPTLRFVTTTSRGAFFRGIIGRP